MYDFVRNPFGLFRGAMEVEALGAPVTGGSTPILRVMTTSTHHWLRG